MLDQNTDRMWYVIGAVLVGAAIILIVNGTLPDMFASVTKNFENVSTEAIMPLHELSGNVRYLTDADMVKHRANTMLYDASTRTYEVSVQQTTNGWNGGIRADVNKVVIPYGASIQIGYDLFIPEGSEGHYVAVDINNRPVDGSATWSETGNDNDNMASRRFKDNDFSSNKQSSLSKEPLETGVWHKIWVSYTNDDPGNVRKLDIYDQTNIGVHNHNDKPVDILIRDVYVVIQE